MFQRIELTEDNYRDITRMYIEERLPSSEIAKIIGVSKSTILNRLRQLNIIDSKRTTEMYISDHQKEQMIILYKMGHSLPEIGDMFGMERSTVWKKLKKWNIPPNRPRQYEINENYFRTIDTEPKAYWLGFLATDGCVSKNSISFGLQKGDIDHLYKFRKDIGSNRPIKIYNDIAVMSVCNSTMAKDLAQYGIVERKSKILEPYLDIDTVLEKDQWRGYIDGDGSLNWDGKYPLINLVGTESVCNAFRDWCLPLTNSKANVTYTGVIYTYKVKGSGCIPIIYELYHEAEVYLDRKYERAMKILKDAGVY